MNIVDHIIGLVEARLELFKLEAKEEASPIIARLLVIILLGYFLVFTWFFLALGMGFLLNDLMESEYLGVLIIAGFHLLIFILIFIFRDAGWIRNMIKSLLDSMTEEDEDE